MVSLAEVLTESDVVFDIRAFDVAAAVNQTLRRTLPRRGFSEAEVEELSSAVAARERISPAICGPVAIPHARMSRLESFIAAVAVNDRGIVEGSDTPRVMIVFLSPASRRQEHLMFLSDLSRMARDESTVNAIATARTPAAVLSTIRSRS